MTVDVRLAACCVYTIRKPEELDRIVRGGEPHVEAKWWAEGSRLLDAARAANQRLPILFADATRCELLLGWGLLDTIEREGQGTRATFSEFIKFGGEWVDADYEGPVTRELVLRATNKPIAPGFIRPYALCKTPWFLHLEAERPVAVRHQPSAWVVKGQPKRNPFEDMLSPGDRHSWITKRPPKEWAVGDFLFLWASSPQREIVGLGRIHELPEELDEEGNTRFGVEYLTGALLHRLGIESGLREDPYLRDAIFLKSGPATTVLRLTPQEGRRLAQLVARANPSCWRVVDDHFGGPERSALRTMPPLDEEDSASEAFDADGVDPEDLEAFERLEGKRVLVTHLSRERDWQLRKRAREHHEETTGGFACSVCGFDFGECYGQLGQGFAEVHHAVPLSTYEDEGAVTRIEDLVVVCANCHRMLHRRRPWLAAADLGEIMKRSR